MEQQRVYSGRCADLSLIFRIAEYAGVSLMDLFNSNEAKQSEAA
jgi:hypothetical protein